MKTRIGRCYCPAVILKTSKQHSESNPQQLLMLVKSHQSHEEFVSFQNADWLNFLMYCCIILASWCDETGLYVANITCMANIEPYTTI
jgi:hypothetical protein